MDKLYKAIQVLEDQINYSVRNMDEVSVELDFESADVILELLKERKPRKVKNIRKVTNICKCGECPSCGERLYTTANPNFCGHCGDRIDWEDGEQREQISL